MALSNPIPEETVSLRRAECAKFYQRKGGAVRPSAAAERAAPEPPPYQPARQPRGALRHTGRIPAHVWPNENLSYTEKENLAFTLHKQSFSLQFFVPDQLLPLSSCSSASRNAPENP